MLYVICLSTYVSIAAIWNEIIVRTTTEGRKIKRINNIMYNLNYLV